MCGENASLAQHTANRKDRIMEDFPSWLEAIIYLIVGGTVLYTVGTFVYCNVL